MVDGERPGIGVIARLRGRELVLDELVFDTVAGERAGGIQSQRPLCATSSLRNLTKSVRSGVASFAGNPQKRRKEERSSSASASFTSDRSCQVEKQAPEHRDWRPGGLTLRGRIERIKKHRDGVPVDQLAKLVER